MPVLFLPGLLLLVLGQPAPSATGPSSPLLGSTLSLIRCVSQITVPMFEQLAAATRELEDDQEMVTPAQIIGMFVDWTDPQKAM